jgi:hypothetical protein
MKLARMFERNILVSFELGTESYKESMTALIVNDRLSPIGKVNHPRLPTISMVLNDKK